MSFETLKKQALQSVIAESNRAFFENLHDFNRGLASDSASDAKKTDDDQFVYLFRMVRGSHCSDHTDYITTPGREFKDHLNNYRFDDLCRIVGPHELLGVAWFEQGEWHNGFAEYGLDGNDVCGLELMEMLPCDVLSSAEALAIRTTNRHLLERFLAVLKKEVEALYRAKDVSGSKSVTIVFQCRSSKAIHHEYYSKMRADFVEGAAVWNDLTAVLDEIGDDQIFENVEGRRCDFVMTEFGQSPTPEDLQSCLNS